ncbi:TIGR02234 family membrane protein [Microtetraspora sp. AC03309]|uniref:TIGR02234 family membrane protein n=1 Tax=Microtetraspora sp. AC03309 TaxID=2779376 RepID=UPI001E5E5A60|nr:TIGR02234 family membrane protein [Microtetraspora sp. AC03309]MCC5575560.1 TIGR02234 family membrane protein [Microtetraspora sp. AC03309]
MTSSDRAGDPVAGAPEAGPPAPSTRPRTARRSLTAWLVACAAGAGLVLLAGGREWASVNYGGTAGAAPVPVSGGDAVPGLTPLALAALAAVLAVFATRGVWRRVVGVVLAACGLAVVALAWPSRVPARAVEVAETLRSLAGQAAHVTVSAWPWAGVAGGVLLALGGVAAVLLGGGWPGMSGKYERRSGDAGRTGAGRPRREVTGDRALWDAIDEGADPTLDPDDRSGNESE